MEQPFAAWEEVAHIPDEALLGMWQLFLAKRHGLSPVNVWGRHGHPRTGLSKARKAELWRDQEWRRWAEKVAAIRVTLKPRGRAESREREEDAVFTVHFRWYLEHGEPIATSIMVVPDGGLAFNENVDLDAHMLACRLQLGPKGSPRRARLPRRPRPGEAPELSFYRQLLLEYEELVKKADPAPARELANRHGLNHSTVKSYLKRGREYLRQEEK
jgi:hypothetical protein